jgi:hypothetical protein
MLECAAVLLLITCYVYHPNPGIEYMKCVKDNISGEECQRYGIKNCQSIKTAMNNISRLGMIAIVVT